MARYNTLKAAIEAVIKTNGANEITGQIMQDSLIAMIESLGANYQMGGVATPGPNGTVPGTPDQNVAFIAGPGSYPNFDGQVIPEQHMGVFLYNGDWSYTIFPTSTVGFTSSGDGIVQLLDGDVPIYPITKAAAVKTANNTWLEAIIKALDLANSSATRSYIFWGVVTTDITPPTPEQPVFYIAAPGTYTHFGSSSLTVNPGYIGIIKYNGSWSLEQVEVGTADAVRYGAEQSLTDAEKAQARINIGAANDAEVVKFVEQTLSDAQKAQARTNIGAADSNEVGSAPTYIVSETGYGNDIAELYIKKDVLAGVSRINLKYASNYLYLRSLVASSGTTALWQCNVRITYTTGDLSRNWENDKIYEIICTDAGGNVGVGDVCGYIVFKNIDHFRANPTDYSNHDIINLTRATSLYLQPRIESLLTPMPAIIPDDAITTAKIADDAVTKAKIADDAVTPSKIDTSAIYIVSEHGYDNDVSEAYVMPDVMTGVTRIALRYYNGYIYLRAGGPATLWTARVSGTGIENGKVIEFNCTTSGGAAQEGDTCGYIVFRDIAHFVANGTSASYADLLDIGRAQMLWLQPYIEGYITSIQDLPTNKIVGYGIEISIPDVLPVVLGNTLRIYWRSVLICPNPYIYDVGAVADRGKSYPRYYEITPNAVGDTTVTVHAKNSAGEIMAQKSVTVRCVAAMSSPAAQTNILTIGASATARGYLAGELKRRLTDNTGAGTSQYPTGLALTNIAFVGRKQGTLVPTVQQEATGGWSWKTFAGEGRAAYRFYVTGVHQLNIDDVYTQNNVDLTIAEINVTDGAGEIRCTYEGNNAIAVSGTLTLKTGTGDATITYTSYDSESFNPFWNPDKVGGAGLDFINYANQYCNGSIGILLSHCGMNDISRYTPLNLEGLFTDYVKPFVRAFHTDFPNGKFIFSTLPLGSPDGGMAANYGASAFWNFANVAKMLFRLAELAREMASESEFANYFSVADVIPSFDCENLYPVSPKVLALRLTATENLQSNGVHPTEQGSYTVSDAIYNHINSLLR